ncbi:YcnI family protein [Nocardia sp. NPDC003482]
MRTPLAVTLGIGVTALLCAPATAHVTASAPDATAGGHTVVSLRVPTESDKAGTVRLEVTIPTDHPITEARTEPIPGWDATVRRTPLPAPIDDGHGHRIGDAVSTVLFTARDGAAIGPGQFAEFRILLGPLPDAAELVLPTIQTYSDGTSVGWIERSADGTEPDKPAPVLRLSGGHEHAHGDTTEAAAPHSDSAATWLAGAALVVALAAAAIAGAPAIRARLRKP